MRLPGLIGNRMVLQRDTELTLWGWADPGEKVTVRLLGKYYDTAADSAGNWSVALPPHPAGGPYALEVNEIVLRDVLIGDVYLFSGQSNQETPMNRLLDKYPEINGANNPMIRHFKVPTKTTVEGLQADIPAGAEWLAANAVDVMRWTGLAYFFAQEAYERFGVPVGILNSSVGGTAIDGWISQEYLKDFPRYTVDPARLDSLRRAQMAARTTDAANRPQTPQAPAPRPVDQGAGKWMAEDWDDSDWATVDLPSSWREQGIEARGTVWFRKTFELPASMDGKHARLYLGTLIDSDSTFVNGVFVGNTTYQYPPRKYDVLAGILHEGTNTVAVKLTANSGNGEFIRDKIYKLQGDDVTIDLSGAWKYKIGLHNPPAPRPAGGWGGAPVDLGSRGSGYYNAMIYPIRDYKVKAAVWYQGESNTGRPQEYGGLLEALIANWRALWDEPELPFMIVQLPGLNPASPQPQESGMAGVRQAQMETVLKVPHTALTTTYDIGEWNDIHPLNKKDLAHRLILNARKLVFGEEIVSSGPLFEGMTVDGNRIILTFTEIGSGLASDGPLRHFAIAGKDRKFVWADAVIEGNRVIVSAPTVKKPVAVRYAWSDNPQIANLRNREGLLASPFRTDEW
ncbi:MAG: sialate O-acetylesterase [Rikenellaceae bacterium]|nr:sialate O-acetylesterase [Rikenellaceae bacterium]